MNGLLDYLSPDQQRMAQQQATTQGLLGLGSALLQASQGAPGQRRPNLGQVLGQALPVGMQAYQGGIDQALRQVVAGQQMQELQRKRQQDAAALARQEQIRQAMMLGTPQEQIGGLRSLGAYDEISKLAGAERAVRQSGLMRQPGEVMDNPFATYQMSDIPGVKKLADQYATSYNSGALNDETATTRLGELARMEESALARQESAADRKSAAATAAEERKFAREQSREDRLAAQQRAEVDRQINREAQQAERDIKRLEGTEGQKLAAGFAARMESANRIIAGLEPAGGLPGVMTEVAGAIPFVGGYAQRMVMSPEQQKYKQAADNWIRANLRKESGAAIGEGEMEAEYRTYFPQPGDSPEVIQQKADARQITTDAMKQNAGPVYRPTQAAVRPTAQQPRPQQQRRPLSSIFGQ
jgi:hypothetical protein